MKTLKIDNQTHIRLTLFKNIHKDKTFDDAINNLISACINYEYEYGDLTVEEYKLLTNDK